MPARTVTAPLLEFRDAPAPEELLTDADVLARIVRQAESPRLARAIAERLLDESRRRPRSSRALCRTDGSGGIVRRSHPADRSALQLGLRAMSPRPSREPMSAANVAAMFHPLLNQSPHEEMHVVMLDARRRFRLRRRVAQAASRRARCSSGTFWRPWSNPVARAGAGAQPPFRCLSTVAGGRHPHCPRGARGRDDGAWILDDLVIAEDGHASAMPSGGRWSGHFGSRGY